MSNLRSISKEQYYSIIKKWAEENGRSPSKEDFESNPLLPSPRTLEENMKIPWNKALKELGLDQIKDKTYYKFLTNEELLNEFKKEYSRVQPNDRKEFDKVKDKSFPGITYLEKRFNLKWNELLKKSGLKTKKEYHTKEEYLEIFKNVCNKLEHTPSMNELEQHSKCSIRAFFNAFDVRNYNDFLQRIGYDIPNITPVEVKETDAELLQMYVDFSEKLGRPATYNDLNESKEIYNAFVFMVRFTTMANLRRLAGIEWERNSIPLTFTKQQIIQILISLYKKYGRRLVTSELKQELKDNVDCPSLSTIQRNLKTTSIKKTWNEVEKYMSKQGVLLDSLDIKDKTDLREGRYIKIDTIDAKKFIYDKFKQDYIRMCKELNKKYVTGREYDANSPYISRVVLRRELNETYGETVRKCGFKTQKPRLDKEKSDQINNEILKLRLQGKSFTQIASELDIKMSSMTVKRRLDKIYNNVNDNIKSKLDKVTEQNFCNKSKK